MDGTPIQWAIEPLRRYAQFTGRARRAEYWWFVVLGLVIGIVAALIDYGLGLKVVGVDTLASLALFVPQLAVSIRRLHDVDRTGWWAAFPVLLGVVLGVGAAMLRSGGGEQGAAAIVVLALALVLIVFAIVLLVWFCTRGTAGPNRFGPDPLAAD